MRARQTLPLRYLLSDQRNDAVLESAIARLPAGSGFVLRHYHLSPRERAARLAELRPALRSGGHMLIVARDAQLARSVGADGLYGDARTLARCDLPLRFATAHDGGEIQAAVEAGADAIMLSPVFPTRSHDDARMLGPVGFGVLAQQSPVPVIALGGMTPARAREMGNPRWAAIDGLSELPA